MSSVDRREVQRERQNKTEEGGSEVFWRAWCSGSRFQSGAVFYIARI